ncbi:hypothetical protein HK405_005971, partial [Cladochytrium tenue]
CDGVRPECGYCLRSGRACRYLGSRLRVDEDLAARNRRALERRRHQQPSTLPGQSPASQPLGHPGFPHSHWATATIDRDAAPWLHSDAAAASQISPTPSASPPSWQSSSSSSPPSVLTKAASLGGTPSVLSAMMTLSLDGGLAAKDGSDNDDNHVGGSSGSGARGADSTSASSVRRPGAPRAEEQLLLSEFLSASQAGTPAVVHRRSFAFKLATAHDNAGIGVDPALRLVACAAGAFFSARTPPIGTHDALWYYRQARARCELAIEEPTLERLQAQIIMMYLLEIFGDKTGAWQRLGVAVHMALYLKLDVDPDNLPGEMSSGMTWVEKETRRRCWWTCYMMERTLGTMGGQIPFLKDNSNTVKPLCSDELWFSPDDPAALENEYARGSKIADNLLTLVAVQFDLYSEALRLATHRPGGGGSGDGVVGDGMVGPAVGGGGGEAERLAAEAALDKRQLYFAAEVPSQFALATSPAAVFALLHPGARHTDWPTRLMLFALVRAAVVVNARRRALRYVLAASAARAAAAAVESAAAAVRAAAAAASALATSPEKAVAATAAASTAAAASERLGELAARTAAFLAPAYRSAYHRGLAAAAEVAAVVTALARLPMNPLDLPRGVLFMFLQAALALCAAENAAEALGVDDSDGPGVNGDGGDFGGPTPAEVAGGASPPVARVRAWLDEVSAFLRDVGHLRFVAEALGALLVRVRALDSSLLGEMLAPGTTFRGVSLHDRVRRPRPHAEAQPAAAAGGDPDDAHDDDDEDDNDDNDGDSGGVGVGEGEGEGEGGNKSGVGGVVGNGDGLVRTAHPLPAWSRRMQVFAASLGEHFATLRLVRQLPRAARVAADAAKAAAAAAAEGTATAAGGFAGFGGVSGVGNGSGGDMLAQLAALGGASGGGGGGSSDEDVGDPEFAALLEQLCGGGGGGGSGDGSGADAWLAELAAASAEASGGGN